MDEFTVGFPFNSKYSQDINTWVEFAAKKGVEKLRLDFSVRIEYFDKEPSYDSGFLASPGAIKFPRLKGNRCGGECYSKFTL